LLFLTWCCKEQWSPFTPLTLKLDILVNEYFTKIIIILKFILASAPLVAKQRKGRTFIYYARQGKLHLQVSYNSGQNCKENKMKFQRYR